MQYYSIKFINYSIFQKNSAHYKVLFDTYNKKKYCTGDLGEKNLQYQ